GVVAEAWRWALHRQRARSVGDAAADPHTAGGEFAVGEARGGALQAVGAANARAEEPGAQPLANARGGLKRRAAGRELWRAVTFGNRTANISARRSTMYTDLC